MATGIAGDTSPVTIGADPVIELLLIETRAQSVLLQQLLGSDQAQDQIGELRNDQAFQLGIPVPLPGTGL
jgi:hypothetical protein